MILRIAVSDPLPVFRRGMIATLCEAGFPTEAPTDIAAWARAVERPIVVMTLQSSEDWVLLTQLLHSRPGVMVVAVLNDPSVTNHVRALRAGAACAVPRDAASETMREAVEAAVSGKVVVPTAVLQALTLREETPADAGSPSTREIEWLQQLAGGSSVAQLASQAGYSERAMFRLLRGLYAKIGVKNRTQALIHARDRGWL